MRLAKRPFPSLEPKAHWRLDALPFGIFLTKVEAMTDRLHNQRPDWARFAESDAAAGIATTEDFQPFEQRDDVFARDLSSPKNRAWLRLALSRWRRLALWLDDRSGRAKRMKPSAWWSA